MTTIPISDLTGQQPAAQRVRYTIPLAGRHAAAEPLTLAAYDALAKIIDQHHAEVEAALTDQRLAPEGRTMRVEASARDAMAKLRDGPATLLRRLEDEQRGTDAIARHVAQTANDPAALHDRRIVQDDFQSMSPVDRHIFVQRVLEEGDLAALVALHTLPASRRGLLMEPTRELIARRIDELVDPNGAARRAVLRDAVPALQAAMSDTQRHFEKHLGAPLADVHALHASAARFGSMVVGG